MKDNTGDKPVGMHEDLMRIYCKHIGSDSIIGLHVCDDYLDWEKDYLKLGDKNNDQ